MKRLKKAKRWLREGLEKAHRRHEKAQKWQNKKARRLKKVEEGSKRQVNSSPYSLLSALYQPSYVF